MTRRALAVLPLLLTLGAAAPAGAQELDFKRCGPKGFQCTKVAVPLDYGDPAGPQIELNVTRRKALQPRKRQGALFVNYGGPGGDAVKTTQSYGRQLFAPLRNRFDLVAVDPRGTGKSVPVSCKVNQETEGIYRMPYPRPDTVDPAAEEAKARALGERCVRRNPEVAAHLSTANVARDFDAVRAALGLKQINYVGFSYGTLLGATYLKLFPQHAGSFVLDGAVDPSDYLLFPEKDVRTQTRAFERALDRYFAACERARRFCRWVGKGDAEAAYDRLVARAQADPLEVRRPKQARGRKVPVDGDGISTVMVFDLYAKQYWGELTTMLNQAKRGDGTLARRLLDLANGRRKDGSYKPDNDRFLMISASEAQYGRDPAPYFERAETDFTEFPHFFFNSGYADLNWALYPVQDADAYLGPFDLAPDQRTPLVIGTTNDPATPYTNAKRMTGFLGNARLLTMRGDGHTAFGGNSRCIDRTVLRYLVRQRLPREGATCRQQVPFPDQGLVISATASAAVNSRPAPVEWRPGGRR